MTVGEVTARMTPAELREWQAVDWLRAKARGEPLTPEEKVRQGLAEQASAKLDAMTAKKRKR